MMPTHDVRSEKERVRQHMAAIRAVIATGGAAAQGPAHYALGRGHLALGEVERARVELDAAWAAGYRTPEVSLALGEVLGALYQRALDEAETLPDDEARRATRQGLETAYREPALAALRAGAEAKSRPPAYVDGLIALHEKRYDAAVERAEQAMAAAPWFYEAKRLAGDAYRRQAADLRLSGDRAGAERLLDRAGEAFRAAADLARSDESVFVAQCQRWIGSLSLESDEGDFPEAHFAGARQACDTAISIDPDDATAYGEESMLFMIEAEHLSDRGEPPFAAVQRSVEAANRALQRDPKLARVLVHTASAYLTQAEAYEAPNDIDPTATLERAEGALTAALALHPDAETYNALGRVYSSRARYLRLHGGDPSPAYRRAVESYQRALALTPDRWNLHHNLGNAHESAAEYELLRGGDPRPFIEVAVREYEASIALNPRDASRYNGLGAAYFTRASFEIARGLDPREALDDATSSYRRGIEGNPGYVYGYDNLAEAYALDARYRVEQDRDPGEPLGLGHTALDQGAAVNAKDPFAPLRRCQLDVIAARWSLREARDDERALLAAEQARARALELTPDSEDALKCAAEAHRRRAEWLRARGRPTDSEIARGLSLAERAPKLAEAVAERGALLLERARSRTKGSADASAIAREAHSSLEAALGRNALLPAEYRALLAESSRLGDGS
jgi:serine/threonine-protein kinase